METTSVNTNVITLACEDALVTVCSTNAFWSMAESTAYTSAVHGSLNTTLLAARPAMAKSAAYPCDLAVTAQSSMTTRLVSEGKKSHSAGYTLKNENLNLYTIRHKSRSPKPKTAKPLNLKSARSQMPSLKPPKCPNPKI